MTSRIRSHLILATLATAGLAASLSPVSSQTQIIAAQPEAATLSVIGKGRAVAKPDQAMLTTGVMTIGTTADQALKANSQAMEIVIGVIKASGVDSRDIGTSGFSIHPQYSMPVQGAREAPRVVGYEVRNGVTVKVRELGILGSLFDRVVQSGANQASGLTFLTSDPDALDEQARLAAVKDATAQAGKVAAAAGVRILRIKSIQPGTEHGSVAPVMAVMEARAGARAVPIEAGTTEARASAVIVYEIAPL